MSAAADKSRSGALQTAGVKTVPQPQLVILCKVWTYTGINRRSLARSATLSSGLRARRQSDIVWEAIPR
jgi:hypothetical protein